MSNTPHELAQEFPEHAEKMHALKTGEAHGIWGGLNEVERRALRAQP